MTDYVAVGVRGHHCEKNTRHTLVSLATGF